jgi:hypothetical protein
MEIGTRVRLINTFDNYPTCLTVGPTPASGTVLRSPRDPGGKAADGPVPSSPMRSSAGPATGAWPSDRRDSNPVPIRDKLAERAGDGR